MSYFLTVHMPIPVDENQTEFDRCIWINQTTPHWIDDIRPRDRVAVYEVATSKTPGKVMIGSDPHDATLPRGGIVSLFEVSGTFFHDPGPYEGNIYLGNFKGDYISQNFIPLKTLAEAWLRVTGKHYNPRLKGGIRRLSEEEYQLIVRLMGVLP